MLEQVHNEIDLVTDAGRQAIHEAIGLLVTTSKLPDGVTSAAFLMQQAYALYVHVEHNEGKKYASDSNPTLGLTGPALYSKSQRRIKCHTPYTIRLFEHYFVMTGCFPFCSATS